MKRTTLLLVFLVLLISAPAFPSQRVIILSWDAAADWVVDRLLAEGQLPNIAKMAESGVRAEYMTTSYPSKTAAAHASLWTGAYGNVNGITGNRVPLQPRNEHYFTETVSGFLAEPLTAEPIWVAAARNGKKVALLQATQIEPTSQVVRQFEQEKIPQEGAYITTGFTYPISPPQLYTDFSKWKNVSVPQEFPSHSGQVKNLSFKVAETSFTASVFDSTTDPTQGYDTVLIRTNGSSATSELKPGWSTAGTTDRFSRQFAVKKDGRVGYVHFRLFDLSPDGSSVILYQTAANAPDSTQPEKAAAVYAAAGGFLDGMLGFYMDNRFGKTIWSGGDGTAEKRLLELIRLDTEKLKKGTLYAISNLKWDLMLNYSGSIDGVGHAWMGVLDPQSGAYNPDIAARLWPYYAEAYKLHDEWLGAVIKAAPKDTAVFLVSDHGMQGVSKTFYTNRLLEKAGLTVIKPDGTVDPASSKATAVGDGLSIHINTTDHKGGIVPPDQKEALLQQITSLFLSFTDPETGRSVVTKVFRQDDAPDVGTGGPNGADLMIDVASDYDAMDIRGQQGVVINRADPIGKGIHGGFPYTPKLRAIFYASGAGIAAGKTVAPMRTVDVAPTASKLLGIPYPEDAVGDAVSNALR